MRILFVADGRSPIALNWISYFVEQGHAVHLVSTFACRPALNLASLKIIPAAFSQLKKANPGQGGKTPLWGRASAPLRTVLRQWLGPLTLNRPAQALAEHIASVQPELIHAMRIPYEGMLAGLALAKLPAGEPPLLVSVWGNDFTLHAPANPWMGRLTRQALAAASGLHCDCHRDVRLAHAWGFAPARPAVVLPGAGGVQPELFTSAPAEGRPPLVINPRGVRAYVRNDTFFEAARLLLERRPEVRFVCPAMQDQPGILPRLEALGIVGRFDLLPPQSRAQMAELFRQAQVTASITTHDGTPNTLLEAMACGSFPVVGDLESLREWLTHGENGLLVDPGDPAALAQALELALGDLELRRRALATNTRLIAERAAYPIVMESAARFYREFIEHQKTTR